MTRGATVSIAAVPPVAGAVPTVIVAPAGSVSVCAAFAPTMLSPSTGTEARAVWVPASYQGLVGSVETVFIAPARCVVHVLICS